MIKCTSVLVQDLCYMYSKQIQIFLESTMLLFNTYGTLNVAALEQVD